MCEMAKSNVAPRQNRKKYFLIGLTLACVVAGAYWYALAAWKAGDLCLAPEGVQPEDVLFTDADVFRAFAGDLRDGARAQLARQFDPATGFFRYSDTPSGETSSGNNDIRQLLASRVVALESHTDEAMLAIHDANLAAIMRNWYQEDASAGFVFADEKSKLGANAMLLRTLVASPHFESYRDEAEKLVRSIELLQTPDGSFSSPWYREPDYEYDADYLLTFYSGEAILALMEYVEKTEDARAYAIAVRVQDFYITHYVTNLEENYYPAYVPWHTASLALLYERTKNKKYADAVFVLNDKLLEIQDTERFVGRFYNPATPQYGTPHASSDAVYTEGLAYAYGVAKMTGDAARTARYHDAIVLGIHNLESLRYEPRFWYFDDGEASERLRGGIMTNACSRWIRIDTTAHAIDGLTKILEVWE